MIKSIKKISKKHYIQCGLAILLTGLVLYFTSALWFSKAVIVSFNAEAKKNIQYQVFYLEANGQGMDEKHSVRKNIKSGSQKVEILLPISKLIKLRLDIGYQPGEVIISDLQVKGSKNVKLNYNEFNKNQIDKYEVKDGKLYITSGQGDPYISYKQELNLPAGMQIDWCRLIIISVLAFLLMYKFVQYLSKFKIEKHHSRIDIVMLAVFFALLFIPMSHISDAEKSEQEKRMLAKKPQLTIDGGGYNNYGVQFDAWYNDHFFGRDAMMWLYNRVLIGVNDILENKIVYYDKKSKWIFHKARYDMKATDDEKKGVLSALEKVNNFAKANNIKFYLFILPHKTDVYTKFHPMYATEGLHTLHIDYIDYLQKNANFPVIYPLNELKEASKNDYVYFKRSHHWTEWGAYNGYLSIVKILSKDFDNIRIVEDKDYTIFYDDKVRDDWSRKFDGYRGVYFPGIMITEYEKYKYYDPNKKIEINVIDSSKHRIKEFKNNFVDNNLKVVLTGTSNNENLLQFLPYSFNDLRYLRFNAVKDVDPIEEYKLMKRYKQYIIDYKPDILIISIVADNIPALINLSKEN